MAEQRVSLTVAPSVDRPIVGVCAGKNCGERCETVKVRKALGRGCVVVDLKCVGVCSGPVVVVDPACSKPAVYSKLRTKKQRSLLIDLISGDGRACKELADRRVTKKKVVAAVVRQSKRRIATGRAA